MSVNEKMTSKEIITRIIEYRDPPRIGFDFNPPHERDIRWETAVILKNPAYENRFGWGKYPEVKAQVPDFRGEVRYDIFGNIYGRLGDGKGECIKGAIQEDWSLLDSYELPQIDYNYYKGLQQANLKSCDQFVLGSMPIAVFSTLRDARLMDNALADTILEPEHVKHFLAKIQKLMLEVCALSSDNGFDGLIIYDDWGMQHSSFVSPQIFRELFKPVYKAVADELHSRGMKLFVHSCGLVYGLMEDFIDAGVDVMQFDQPELSGSDVLSREFGGRIAFHSPVDIQKIMTTGDRKIIEQGALHMVETFKKNCGGGLIAKDYPTWQDISVEQEWADWARKIIVANAKI